MYGRHKRTKCCAALICIYYPQKNVTNFWNMGVYIKKYFICGSRRGAPPTMTLSYVFYYHFLFIPLKNPIHAPSKYPRVVLLLLMGNSFFLLFLHPH